MDTAIVESFEDLYPLLSKDALRGISQLGFESPSIIQKKCLLPLLLRRDCVIQSPAGSGKTAVFGIAAMALIEQIYSHDPKTVMLHHHLEMTKPVGSRFIDEQALITQEAKANTNELAESIYKKSTAINKALDQNGPAVVIVSPTRELAKQTFDFMCSVGDSSQFIRDRGGLLTVGEKNPTSTQLQQYTFISATVGKLTHLIMANKTIIKNIKLVIIDEADRMLSESFLPEIEEFLSHLMPACTVSFFSATMPGPVVDIIRKYCIKNRFTALLRKKDVVTNAKVRHTFVDLTGVITKQDLILRQHEYNNSIKSLGNSENEEDNDFYEDDDSISDFQPNDYANEEWSTSNKRKSNKKAQSPSRFNNIDDEVDIDNSDDEDQKTITEQKMSILKTVVKSQPFVQCIIFANKKATVEEVYAALKKLSQCSAIVAKIHGSMKPEEREEAMEGFKTGKSRLIVASDVWARGIDVRQINLVINFDMPMEKETYIHRVGRAGRYGTAGVSISILGKNSEASALKRFTNAMKVPIFKWLPELPN